uniref:CsENDO-1 n=1 Tax=Ciona savignyi TaxID=51511 RepID=Q9XY04_CIOSA|nr:CsENDO-1 [Ciona savignyi]
MENLLDLTYLTESERKWIQEVLDRDETIQKAEDARIERLKSKAMRTNNPTIRKKIKMRTGEWFLDLADKDQTLKKRGVDSVRASIRRKGKDRPKPISQRTTQITDLVEQVDITPVPDPEPIVPEESYFSRTHSNYGDNSYDESSEIDDESKNQEPRVTEPEDQVADESVYCDVTNNRIADENDPEKPVSPTFESPLTLENVHSHIDPSPPVQKEPLQPPLEDSTSSQLTPQHPEDEDEDQSPRRIRRMGSSRRKREFKPIHDETVEQNEEREKVEELSSAMTFLQTIDKGKTAERMDAHLPILNCTKEILDLIGSLQDQGCTCTGRDTLLEIEKASSQERVIEKVVEMLSQPKNAELPLYYELADHEMSLVTVKQIDKSVTQDHHDEDIYLGEPPQNLRQIVDALMVSDESQDAGNC